MDFIYNQNIGDGANLFIVIIAVVVGFVSGLGYIDYLRTKKKQEGQR
ncbi:MAG: hypothetical protein OJF59_000144 [Cytophagales bacterium]|jgi:general stress protein CsbA|nr:hypothetical protein [Bacteroidota bacterium]MBS1982134.1 hypothetical protein [Bacteroidota bacterium]WHZ06391.1 MAG: hypothetical protein OJF59_000144 [Cytophagales bacterium]